MNKYLALIIGILTLNATLLANEELSEGEIAPNFSITQFDGTQFELNQFRGKKSVYLVFWNSWCTYCMRKIPKLEQIHKNFTDQIQIIGINTSKKDNMEKSLEFKSRFNIQYPLAFDYGEKVTDLYDVWGTPTEFIIDINGKIIHRDHVPDDVGPLIAQWNMIDNEKEVTKTNKCHSNEEPC